MCGFSAYLYVDKPKTGETLPPLDLQASLKSIDHRGPDSTGTYVSPFGRCALGHARLSIIDLEGGQQPLSSQNGKIHAVVNGELYDHDRLSEELRQKGHVFKTKSDSELALHYYEDFDTDFVQYLRGEFAVVIWDEVRNRMVVARDRFGIKPVYYTTVNGVFMAASEIKAFLALGWKPEWDMDSIMNAGYAIDYRTCFKGVYKLPPAHYLTISASGSYDMKQYWDAEYPDKNVEDTRTVDDMIQGVHDRLVESVRLRLRADVPLGVYLSGGIDSSAVAGVATKLLQEKNPDAKIDTFSISFKDSGEYDEGDIAERTAAHIGANFHKLSLTQDDLVDSFAETVYHCEQPVPNMNAVGKFLLSKFVRDLGFKVVMTGEGSDEHFIGYNFFQTDYLREPDHSSPGGFGCLPEEERQAMLDERLSCVGKLLHFELHGTRTSKSIARYNNSTMAADMSTLLSVTQSFFHPKATEVFGEPDGGNAMVEAISADSRRKANLRWHPVHAVLYLENRTFLSNILCNWLGDRVEMAHSIEARTPFLDHPLCEYVNSLPPSVKLCGQAPNGSRLNEKWVLKQAMKPYITDEIYNRTKHPYLAPTSSAEDQPIIRLLHKWVVKEKVDRLGFLNWDKCQ
ncbi:glutamine-hydrolyzing asparagine synthase, partial [Hesseltinella vesiculosa]